MDLAVEKCEIHELPSARGCTYVVPASDFALALRAGGGFSSDQEMNVARKLGVTDAEVDKLCDAILKALAGRALDPDTLRKAIGNASRSLGEGGKKKGITTTLPLGLSRLQMMGEIRRIPMNGRLDQQRYKYTPWRPNPLAKFKLQQDEVNVELAKRYFRWIGPATSAEFQWFSGFGVTAAKDAMAVLGLVRFEEDRWMFAEDLDSLRSHKIPQAANYKLTSSLDAMTLLRRDHKMLLEGPSFKKLGSFGDPPHHLIFDRGRIVGVWEFDTDSNSIVWHSFEKADWRLEEAVTDAQHFIRNELGDVRSFSLDSPKSRVPKIEAIRKMSGK